MNINKQNTIKVQYYNLNRDYEISEVIASIFDVTSNILVSNLLAIHVEQDGKFIQNESGYV